MADTSGVVPDSQEDNKQASTTQEKPSDTTTATTPQEKAETISTTTTNTNTNPQPVAKNQKGKPPQNKHNNYNNNNKNFKRNNNNNNNRYNNNRQQNNSKAQGGQGDAEHGGEKRKREHAIYGNYERYYGYRPAGEMDNRMKLLSKEMFYQKRCLDIGCNSGDFTLQVATKLQPRYILGMDIDKVLISKANKNIKTHLMARVTPTITSSTTTTTTSTTPTGTTETKEIEMKETTQTTTASAVETKDVEMTTILTAKTNSTAAMTITTAAASIINTTTEPVATTTATANPVIRPTIDGVPYFPVYFGEVSKEALALPKEVFFPENVRFRGENFVENEEVTERYDVIFCLSVSKWVQLNWGDEGLKKMFQKIYNSLYEGGVFIFEPQPWSSYKKRARLTGAHQKNYQNAKLKPEEYSSYLTTKVGFKTVEVLPQPAGTPKGFDRPVYLYKK